MALDYFLLIVEWAGLIAAMFVIGFGLLLLYLAFAAVAKARRTQKGVPESPPSARRTLAEQLKSPSPRIFCYINSDEVRRLYHQTVGRPIPRAVSHRDTIGRTDSVEAGAHVVRGSVAETRLTDHGAEFEPPSEYELATEFMESLVGQNRVWFGLGAETPDQVKLQKLHELLRGLGELGASDVMDTKRAQEHAKRLESGPAVSLESRLKDIDEARRKYTFVAMKSRFTCVCTSAGEGAATPPTTDQAATGLKLDLSGVSVWVDLPAEKVRPEVEAMFRHSRVLEDFMIFGSVIEWTGSAGNPPTLRINPLVASLSWTES